MITLVLGGARSGKSRFAESLAEKLAIDSVKAVTYIATAEAFDEDMQHRISEHQNARQHHGWQTIEEPVDLASAITSVATDNVILIDCLTLWLNNLLYYQKTSQVERLFAAIQARKNVILVSNELGLGVLPADKASRDFIDHAGLLNQQLASRADAVYFVVAGIAQKIK